MNLDIRKVDTIIQKINYLFKTIKKNKDKNLPAERMLLKKYSTDLLDALLESEIRFEPIEADLLKPPVLSDDINDTGLIALQNLKQSKEAEAPQLKVVDFDEKLIAENPFIADEEPEIILEEENTLEGLKAANSGQEEPKPEEPEEVMEEIPEVVTENLQFIPEEAPQVIEEAEERSLIDELLNNNDTEDDQNVRTEVLGSLRSTLGDEVEEEPYNPEPKMELNDLLANDNKNEMNLADKLRQNLVADKFDISDTQRFSFINELFNGDVNAYEVTLRELNKKSTVIDAFSYINLNVKVKYGWEDDSPTTRNFQEIVKNRFFRK